MEMPVQALGRELLSNGRISQTDLCLATGLPSWKISRLLKRFEILGFVEVEKESHFTRGRPRKLYGLTASGIEFFTGLLRSNEDLVENRAPFIARGVAGRREG